MKGLVFGLMLAVLAAGMAHAEGEGMLIAKSDDFWKLVPRDAKVEKVTGGFQFTEGPVWHKDGFLLFSDCHANGIMKWDPSTAAASLYRAVSGLSNGLTFDRQGRLIAVEYGMHRLTRQSKDGRVSEVVSKYEGKRLNSTNDVVVKSDGSVWFTDPPYGIYSHYEGHKAESEYGGQFVFRADPETGAVDVMAEDFVRPNGLAFSPDETILYIADSGLTEDHDGPHHIRAFDVEDGRRLTGGRILIEVSPGFPDGLRVDTEGFIWSSAADGVHCYAPDGRLLGKILVPETVANVTFGGPERNRLFVTATSSLYSIYLNREGAQRP